MHKTKLIAAVSVVLAFALPLTQSARAGEKPETVRKLKEAGAGNFHVALAQGPETVRKLKEAGAILPLEQIVQRAQAIKAGEILETELERKRERYVYEVEILDAGGRVWEIDLDAKTGQLIKLEQD